MNIIHGIVLCSVLIFSVTAKHGSSERKVLAGYVPGVSGMPPINVTNCITPEIAKDPSLSNALECARTCHVGEKPRTCYYKFVLERFPINGQACSLCTPNVTNSICPNCQCVPGDGIERMALTVNRMIPGPSIQVCLKDYVVVDVENKIKDEGVTIHWHGVYQKGYQYCDGVPQITQCSIAHATTFRYQFRVNNGGTHFWHAHSGFDKMDGIFGSLIVRDPIEQDPHRHLYDFDLANHVIVINDWMHEGAIERYPGRNGGNGSTQGPDAFLINGKGRVLNINGTTTNTSLEVIHVEPNKRYRFRLVNSFCTICPGELIIEGHNLTVIASDGQSSKPVVVDAIVSLPGERYDFIVHTNKEPGAYWIQLRGLNRCALTRIHQLAILQYTNAPTKPKTSQPLYDSLPATVILNPVNTSCTYMNPNAVCVSNLTHARSVDSAILKRKPDLQFYMPIGFWNPSFEEIYRPNTYRNFLVPGPNNLVLGIMGNIQFSFPPSPPLSQLQDLPPHQLCDAQHLPPNCGRNCSCTHVVKVPLNAVVELILVDVSGNVGLTHPFHLHGYAFSVLSMDQPLGPYSPTTALTVDVVKKLDRRTNLQRNFHSPPGKDTIGLPNNGYAVLRFRANNPGFWLFHCHFIYHQNAGMELVFKVGKQSDLPPVPKNFPRCGDFKLDINPNNKDHRVDQNDNDEGKGKKEEQKWDKETEKGLNEEKEKERNEGKEKDWDKENEKEWDKEREKEWDNEKEKEWDNEKEKEWVKEKEKEEEKEEQKEVEKKEETEELINWEDLIRKIL